MLCAKFGWILYSGYGDENGKSLRQWQWQRQQQWCTIDKFWSEKLTWAFCSSELKRSNDLILKKNNMNVIIKTKPKYSMFEYKYDK